MINPLTDRAQALSNPAGQVIDLTEWCEERNAHPLSRSKHWWYFVNKDDEGRRFIDRLEGPDGAAVRKLIDGRLEDYATWSEDRMAKYRRWLWSCIERGRRSGR